MDDDEDATTTTAKNKLVSYVDRKDEFHVLIQNTIDASITGFVTDLETAIDVYKKRCKPIIEDGLSVPAFIRKKNKKLLKDAVRTENNNTDTDIEEERNGVVLTTPAIYEQEMKQASINNHCNFDSDKDTEQQVRNFLLLYKEGYRDYPWELYKCKSSKSILFIPTIAQLRIDKNDGSLRRGPLLEYNVILSLLSFAPKRKDSYKKTFDQRCVVVLKRLLKMGLLLIRSDIIQEYRMLERIMQADKKFFYKERFQFVLTVIFLIPRQLLSLDSTIGTPLHFVASKDSSIETFRAVFETGLRVYPKMIGINLLYRMNRKEQTPFTIACQVHGREKIMEVIQSSLIDFRTVKALFYATLNTNTHVEGVYSMLRTQPEVLQQLLLPQPPPPPPAKKKKRSKKRKRS